MRDRLLTIREASKAFNVSDFTLRRRIAAGELTVYTAPLDRRARLLDAGELARYAAPRPLSAPRVQEEVPA